MRWLREAEHLLFRAGQASAVIWLAVYLVGLGLGVTYGFWVDHKQDAETCRLSHQAVVVGSETLIEVANRSDEPPDPAILAEYRRILGENLHEAGLDC